jgi:peptidoglycan LD-endopeptidase CwlK
MKSVVKGIEAMKRKRSGRSFIVLVLGLVAVLIWLYNNKGSDVPFPAEIHPVVEEQTNKLIQQAADKGILVVITDGYRSAEDQDRLYEKGRTASGTIVTQAKGGQSFHNYGLAVDFALKNYSGDIIWDMNYDGNKNSKADWDEVVEMAKTLGFAWGGDWAEFKDYPHLQMDFGLTIADLQNGARPSLTAGPNPGE